MAWPGHQTGIWVIIDWEYEWECQAVASAAGGPVGVAASAGERGLMRDGESGVLAGLVRGLRCRSLLTQDELASRSGLSIGTIRGLESGRIRSPRAASIRLLADALGLSPPDREALVAAARGETAAVDAGPPAPLGIPPGQLPAAVPGFTGRAEALRLLDEELSEAAAGSTMAVWVIAGAAGIGKTTLAVHGAHRVRACFPDGQLYVDLRGFDPTRPILEPADALRGFLHALQVPAGQVPAGVEAQAGLYRSLLAGRRMLVVLDNARNADQVRPLLPGTAGCAVIVTSRSGLSSLIAIEGARLLTLDALTEAESRTLLTRRLGADRISAEPDAARSIIDRCAGLPLALAVAAGHAATHPGFPLATLAECLRRQSDRLACLTGGDPLSDVRTVFSWSYQALTPPAARLFRLLGLHPGPDAGEPAVASLAGLPATQARPLLAELTGHHLITEHTPGRYALHDLLHVYAAELANAEEPDTDRRTARCRMLDHYLHSAHTAARQLRSGRYAIDLEQPQPGTLPQQPSDEPQAMAWFDKEHQVLVEVVRTAATDDTAGARIWQLAWALTDYLFRTGQWHTWATVQELAVAASRRAADLPGQAQAHLGLGRAHVRLGRHESACFHLRRALHLFEQVGDRLGQARSHNHLGDLMLRQNDHQTALHHANQASDLFQAAGHGSGQANALNGIGWLHAQLGDHHQALAYGRRALDLQQRLGDPYGAANSWDTLGYAYSDAGDHRQAVACYQRAIELYRASGDRYNEADTLVQLGDAHHRADQPDAARQSWQRALDILTALDHPEHRLVRERLRTCERRSAVGDR